MRLTVRSLPDSEVRRYFNVSRDGTATDALRRYRCRVALGELCVADDDMPGGLRYPTEDEIHEARREIARDLNARGDA